VNFIEKFVKTSNYSVGIKMQNIDSPLPVSRKYLKQIKEKFYFKN